VNLGPVWINQSKLPCAQTSQANCQTSAQSTNSNNAKMSGSNPPLAFRSERSHMSVEYLKMSV
jgi:hypothetical protein